MVAALEGHITSQSHHSTQEGQLIPGLWGRVALTKETKWSKERTGYVGPIVSKRTQV